MSSGPPVPIIPQVTSAQEYQFNKERLEKARQLLEMYDSMNEDAFRKHREEELAQKIAEGEKAREELERLKSRNAPLAITAPPITNVPQNAIPQSPVYAPTMARIEEAPSYSGFIGQRVHMQNPHPSSSSSQLQVQSWSVPNQASHPHTFFNNSGTIQEQPDQPAASNSHYYRQKAIPSQAVNMNRTEYQAAVQRQARQSAPLQQVTIPTAPVNVHHPPAPQARKKTMLPQPSQSSVQQRSVPPKSHTVAPTAAAGSVRSTEHGRKNNSVYSATPLVVTRQGPSTEPGAAKATVTHATTSASTAVQPKAAIVPATQSFSSTSRDGIYAQVYNQVSSNQNFLDYLRRWYSHWLTSIRPDSYFQIPNTPLFIGKSPDNIMYLVAPNGQSGHVHLDLASLVSQLPVTALLAASQGNAQQSDAGSSQTSVQASAVPQLQLPITEPYSTPLQVSSTQTSVRASEIPPSQSTTSVRASAIPQSQLSTTIQPHSTPSDAGSAQTSVQASGVPHLRLPTSKQHQNQENSSQRTPKVRTPADADRRHLARDILRALGIKRRRSLGALGTQALEPAAKRHQPDSDVRVVPASGTEPSQLVFQVVPIGPEADQPIVPAPPTVNKVQSTQEPAISGAVSGVGTLPVDDGSAQHVSNVIASISVPESTQPNQPVMSIAPPDEPKAAPTTHSPPIIPSVALGTNDELVTVPSTLIDDPSQFGPVIENVAADSAEHLTPEPTFIEIHGSPPLSPTHHSVSYIVESPVAKSLDLRKKSEDAASEFDRLSIQDEVISPATANHREPSLEIEELADEVVMQEVREVPREGEIVMLQDEREPSQEGEVSMQEDELEASQEEGEISMQQDEFEASQEEGEILMQQDVPESEGIVLVSPDAGGVSSVLPATPIQAKEESKKASRTPLFLPSPSASPRTVESPSFSRTSHPPIADYADGDVPGVDFIPETTEIIERKSKSFYRRAKRKDQPFYILVPPPPPYLIKLRKEEARRRRKSQKSHLRTRRSRSASREDEPDPATKKALEDSTTRLVERRCKWNGCDTVMNSPQHLFEHLRRHCVPDPIKKYVLCYWTACGDHMPYEQIDEHLATHAFTPLLCPYEDCEDSFRTVQSLMKHSDLNHKCGKLKRTPEPFAPSVKEPPPVPGEVPAYVIKSGPVRQEPIDDHRHLNTLGPWVYNNIAGPVRVTKKYNAAKGKPDYEFLRDSQFSTNPSQPARIKDMGDLQSVEVSGLVSDGLVIWPPPKKKLPAKNAKTGLKLFMSSSEEDELQDDDLSGNNDLVMEQAPKYEVKHVSNLSRHQTSSEEDAVLSMLTEQ